MKKIIICVLLCALFLAGCDSDMAYEDLNGSYLVDDDVENADVVFDETRLFIKTVEYAMAHEYFICYRSPDGTETEIVKMGIQESPYFIIGDRIYYVQGDTIYSVDFNGENKKHLYDSSADNYSFNWIDRAEGDWLLCSGTKWQEIYGDPVALDGFHRVPVYTKVKANFSEFHEIQAADIEKLEFDSAALYEMITAEVGAANDLIGVQSAGVLIEPNGDFSEMLLKVWAYGNTNGDTDKWNEGNVLIRNIRAYGLYVEFIKTGEFELAVSENPIADGSMTELAAYIADLEKVYNAPTVENNATRITEFKYKS